MALELDDRQRVRTVRCSGCGRRIGRGERFADHLRTDHGPEDFNLSPIGKRRVPA